MSSSSPSRTLRRASRSCLALLVVGFLAAPTAAGLSVPGTTTPSPTPEAGRSWSFWWLKDGQWAVSQTGPYQVVPAEGAVDGWRFATATTSAPRSPRSTPSFEDICGKTAGEAGKKRVGVIVDYGRKADGAENADPPAPIARCAVVPSGASSSEALARVALPRDDKGMVCAIDGYPGGSGCAVALATVPENAQAPDEKVDIAVSAAREQPKPVDAQAVRSTQGPSKTVLTGVAVVVVGAALGAAYLVRRRKAA